LAAEAMTYVYAKSYGLSTISLRFSNVYGPRSAHKANAVPNFIKALLAHRPITIYGDGENTRDFLFVEDLCQAILDVLQARFSGEAVHLGTGLETSVNQLILILQTLTGSIANVVREPGRSGEVRRNFADVSLAKALWGYSPATPLTDGLARTLEWFQSNWTGASLEGSPLTSFD
jgi:UDP-glucose 4-epimerase